MSGSKPQLVQSLSFHAFNKDRSQVCLSKNDEYVYIYNTNGKPDDVSKWTEQCELQEDLKGQEKAKRDRAPPLHPGYVSGIDWHPETNLIVTCGHDRNAYVWKFEKETWKPLLVILRINRAATGVKWSPDGKKFAVTSGAKCVPVCHFETTQNWWISKMIKKHKSTVLCLDWSPNGKFVVTGGCDFRTRVFSAFIEGIDNPDAGDFGHWASGNEFGEELMDFDMTKAWVQGVSWAPSGNYIAFVGHGSTLHVADVKSGSCSTSYCTDLPYHDVTMIGDNKLVATGFNYNPHVWEGSGDSWKLSKKLDPETDGEQKKAGGAMAKFKSADDKGEDAGGEPIKTFHKNVIRDVKIITSGGKITGITTTGLDGRCLTWSV